MQTTAYKCPRDGWRVTTSEQIGTTEEGHARILEFNTSKWYSGTICTAASVHTVDPATKSKTTLFFDDYLKPVQNHGKIRATEKNVKAAHDAAILEHAARHIEAALAHYASA